MLYAGDRILFNSPMAVKTGKTQDPAPSRMKDEMQGEVTFDDLLVAVGKTRNRDAFVQIFEYFAPRVKSFLMKAGLGPDIADELAQDTLLTLWQKADSYNPEQAAASTWIFTIARNKRIDYLRKQGRSKADPHDPLLQGVTDVGPDQSVGLAEERAILASALRHLPDDQAALIKKSFYEDKTHTDIAAEMNLPLGTVKSRIRLALEKLRYGMRDKEFGDIR